MFELQIFLQRRRKWLIRSTALLAIGIAGLLLVLPRADANDAQARSVAQLDISDLLLSPEPVSGRQFSALYVVKNRQDDRLAQAGD